MRMGTYTARSGSQMARTRPHLLLSALTCSCCLRALAVEQLSLVTSLRIIQSMQVNLWAFSVSLESSDRYVLAEPALKTATISNLPRLFRAVFQVR
jgi:hypothetical protein